MVFFTLFLGNNKLYTEVKNNKKLGMMMVAWFALLMVMNFWNMQIEGRGVNVFLEYWLTTLVFFVVNIYIITEFIKN